MLKTSHNVARHVPSHREIEQMCVQIQRDGSPTERFWRIVGNRPAWLFPRVQFALLPLEPVKLTRSVRN